MAQSVAAVAARVKDLVRALDEEREARAKAEERARRAEEGRVSRVPRELGETSTRRLLEEKLVAAENALLQREDALRRLAKLNDTLAGRLERLGAGEARLKSELEDVARRAEAECVRARAKAVEERRKRERLEAELAKLRSETSRATSGVAESVRAAEQRAFVAERTVEAAMEAQRKAEVESRANTRQLRNALRNAREAEARVVELEKVVAEKDLLIERAERRGGILGKRVRQLERAVEKATGDAKGGVSAKERCAVLEQRLKAALGAKKRGDGARERSLKQAVAVAQEKLARASHLNRLQCQRTTVAEQRVEELERILDKAGQLVANIMAATSYDTTSTASPPHTSEQLSTSSRSIHRLKAMFGKGDKDGKKGRKRDVKEGEERKRDERGGGGEGEGEEEEDEEEEEEEEEMEEEEGRDVRELRADIRLLQSTQVSLEKQVGEALRSAAVHEQQLIDARAEAAAWREEALALRGALEPPTIEEREESTKYAHAASPSSTSASKREP